MTILVVGATGHLGGEICRRLRGTDRPVRALVRPGSPAESRLKEQGAEIHHGDLKDSASLEAACRGASAVMTTATAIVSRRRGDSLKKVDRDGQLALVEAAKRAGTERFVYVSLSPHAPSDCQFIRCKRRVEQAVRASGLKWTILQPSAFMETSFSPDLGWNWPEGKVQIFGSGQKPISYISVADVAGFALLSLDNPGAECRDLPLGGPDPVTPVQAVRIFEEATGRDFRVTRVPGWVPQAARILLKTVSPRYSSLAALGCLTVRGDVIDMRQTLSEFPLPMTSVRDFAESLTPAGR